MGDLGADCAPGERRAGSMAGIEAVPDAGERFETAGGGSSLSMRLRDIVEQRRPGKGPMLL